MNDSNEDPLPDLRSGLLDKDGLMSLLADVNNNARLSRVVIRPLCGSSAPAGLADDRVERENQLIRWGEMLFCGEIGGLQIAYHFDQSDWIDTLSRQDNQIRLIRILQPNSACR